MVIVLGEDLTRFRNASKQLYTFLSSFSWNSRCERLGFDEVWLDVSDMVDSNVATVNSSNLSDSFFRLSKHDPTVGFSFDATNYAGHISPERSDETIGESFCLLHRCVGAVASHLFSGIPHTSAMRHLTDDAVSHSYAGDIHDAKGLQCVFDAGHSGPGVSCFNVSYVTT